MLTTVALSLLFTHELDAMTAREWRLLPGLSRLQDEWGRRIFVVGHVPLVAAVLWGLSSAEADAWRVGLDVFLLLHAAAHLLLCKHAKNDFRRPLSWILIVGAAVVAALDLAL